MKVVTIGVLVGSVAGCRVAEPPSNITGPICATFAAPGITVALLNTLSDQPIVSAATVVARDGAYADSVQGPLAGPTYALAYERPSRYTVSVTAPGYRAWQLAPVVVGHDACHVVTIPLAAHLVPQS